MKFLTNKRMNEINLYTTRLHEIANKKELSIDDCGVLLANIDAIRSVCKLPYIRRFINFAPMPFKIKPPKKERHEHDFFVAHQTAHGAIICCRTCGEIKRIEADPELFGKESCPELFEEATRPKYINLSVNDFIDYCDAAASFAELKELLLEHVAKQEDKQ